MNKNDIIKALECCLKPCVEGINDCPYQGVGGCSKELLADALDLIKRQSAEIEVLAAQNGVNETCSARKQETIERLEIELKAMRAAANSYKLHYSNLRMEIAREFADRLKARGMLQHGGSICVHGSDIDNLLEEMEKECEENQT